MEVGERGYGGKEVPIWVYTGAQQLALGHCVPLGLMQGQITEYGRLYPCLYYLMHPSTPRKKMGQDCLTVFSLLTAVNSL